MLNRSTVAGAVTDRIRQVHALVMWRVSTLPEETSMAPTVRERHHPQKQACGSASTRSRNFSTEPTVAAGG